MGKGLVLKMFWFHRFLVCTGKRTNWRTIESVSALFRNWTQTWLWAYRAKQFKPAVFILFFASDMNTVFWQKHVIQTYSLTQLQHHFLEGPSAMHSICMGSPCKPHNYSLNLLEVNLSKLLCPNGKYQSYSWGVRNWRAEKFLIPYGTLVPRALQVFWLEGWSLLFPALCCTGSGREIMVVTMAGIG